MIQTFVFWVFQTKVEEQDEDELADILKLNSYGQLSIKEDLFGFVGRSLIS
jgi:hypothetical protein